MHFPMNANALLEWTESVLEDSKKTSLLQYNYPDVIKRSDELQTRLGIVVRADNKSVSSTDAENFADDSTD